MASIEDFQKIEVKIGTVIESTKVENTDKLIKLIVDFGEEKRQIVTALAHLLEPEHFLNKQIPILTNLPYRKFRGIESQGMIIAADVDGKPVLVHPEKEVPNGTKLI
tara:strand:- start:3223 stop:3543 length:321 start_codon:yes stop_codon:yes gene_type:complete